MPRKHIAQHLEFNWYDEPLALVREQAIDGEKVAQERAQADQDRKESNDQQEELV